MSDPRERKVLHFCHDGQGVPVEMTCGIPQSSVLRALLWNIALDVVFRLPMPRQTTAIRCVENTLIIAEEDTVDAVQEHANIVLEIVSNHIHGLGLRLLADKT